MRFPFFRTIRTQLLILVFISVLPALGIIIYSGINRCSHEIEDAKSDSLRVVKNFSYDHERVLESTRQFLTTLVKVPDIQNLRKFGKNLWTVEVDRGQVEQFFLNLFVNAWQAMPGGGEPYLDTQNIILDKIQCSLYSLKPGKYVKVSITDTGVGMDEATKQRAFEPFFTTKGMGRGTGLGLASAYGIIKNHGGTINLYSEKGKGTTFTIYLPASEKVTIEEKMILGEVLKGTETILFIDDQDIIINVGKEMLNALGYKVLLAKSGKEALEVFEKNKEKIDLVILDMIMPVMSGGEVYNMLKNISPHIKVILSRGYSMEGQAAEILKRGCNGFIQKPFNIGDLSRKIREVLD